MCDVTDEAQVQAAVQARETFAGLDILVNGAVIFNQKACSTCRWPNGRDRPRSS